LSSGAAGIVSGAVLWQKSVPKINRASINESKLVLGHIFCYLLGRYGYRLSTGLKNPILNPAEYIYIELIIA
jgi:hypothetical protein